MMLVDRDDVETQLLGIDELVDIGGILVGAFFRIIEAVRQHHPGGAMLVALRHVERPVGHQVEEGEFHFLPPMKSRIFPAATSAFSTWGRWPHSGMTSTRLSGIRSAQAFA